MSWLYRLALSTVSCLILASGCSVAKAADKTGYTLEQVQSAKSRAQMQAMAERVVSSEKNSQGQVVEIYVIKKAKGSTSRAVMHGVLDVATLGVWEVAGTPIEGNLNKDENFIIKVTYNDKDTVERIELP